MQLKDLAGRRVAVLGAGREGLATVSAIQRAGIGCQLTVIDEQSLPELPKAVTGMEAPFSADLLCQFDVVVRSPGISCYRPALVEAADRGVSITTPTNLWFADRPRVPVIGITGTKGKSTTCSLVAHLLAAAGWRVELAGNIGRPLLEMDPAADPEVFVVELSSYQLADFTGAVEVAVLTNLRSDHLGWHGGRAQYHRDKSRLLAAADKLVLRSEDAHRATVPADKITLFDCESGWQVFNDRIDHCGRTRYQGPRWPLIGRHNLANLAAAIAAVTALEVDPQPGLDSLHRFRPLPHRLQTVCQLGPLRCVDDSIATTPESVVAALESFAPEPLVLICGGQDRGQDWAPLLSCLARQPIAAVITVGECGTVIADGVAAALPGQRLIRAERLEQAVPRALEIIQSGVVLLSPGAPSFDQFADFEARGERFAALCRQ